MNNKVLTTVKAHGMTDKGDRVIVALSGGADSVVLLNVLSDLKRELDINIYAAHVNHNLRGEESLRDEEFVRSLCKEMDIELFVRSVDVNAICAESGESFELVGRRVRYGFFEELCEALNARVATAHTASDALETALFNIARGTSLSGLCSIPYVRGRVIRPLLDVTREEIEAYADKRKIAYVNDSTNADADICSRNRIRHRVIPELKEINSSLEQNFIKLRRQLSETERFIEARANELIEKARMSYGYSAEVLLSADSAVRNFAIKLIAEAAGENAEYKHIELINTCLEKGGAVELSENCTVIISQGILRTASDNHNEAVCIAFEKNKTFIVNGKLYFIKELSEEEIVYKKLSTLCIGCDKISLSTVFRTRKGGDRFSLFGRGITKDLRKLQNELKIPAENRDSALLLECDGEILWAEDIGVSAGGRYEGGQGIIIEIREGENYA